jgi:hypothetical protein
MTQSPEITGQERGGGNVLVSGLPARRVKGPVETLCDEIGFDFDHRLERSEVLVAFVRELVSELAREREMCEQLAKALPVPAPSAGSGEALALTLEMLAAETDAERIALAAKVHDACHRLNPEDAHPTDHAIDMLSSCASAIRFGLEDGRPIRSRHAADAAAHVWRQLYGINRADRYTQTWQHDWSRRKLLEAIISLMVGRRTP